MRKCSLLRSHRICVYDKNTITTVENNPAFLFHGINKTLASLGPDRGLCTLINPYHNKAASPSECFPVVYLYMSIYLNN